MSFIYEFSESASGMSKKIGFVFSDSVSNANTAAEIRLLRVLINICLCFPKNTFEDNARTLVQMIAQTGRRPPNDLRSFELKTNERLLVFGFGRKILTEEQKVKIANPNQDEAYIADLDGRDDPSYGYTFLEKLQLDDDNRIYCVFMENKSIQMQGVVYTHQELSNDPALTRIHVDVPFWSPGETENVIIVPFNELETILEEAEGASMIPDYRNIRIVVRGRGSMFFKLRKEEKNGIYV